MSTYRPKYAEPFHPVRMNQGNIVIVPLQTEWVSLRSQTTRLARTLASLGETNNPQTMWKIRSIHISYDAHTLFFKHSCEGRLLLVEPASMLPIHLLFTTVMVNEQLVVVLRAKEKSYSPSGRRAWTAWPQEVTQLTGVVCSHWPNVFVTLAGQENESSLDACGVGFVVLGVSVVVSGCSGSTKIIRTHHWQVTTAQKLTH